MIAYLKILDEIQTAIKKSGRPQSEVRCVAVSKGQSVDNLLTLHQLGQTLFAENYVQEWKKKDEFIQSLNLVNPIEWHFTGRLQTNKIKYLIKSIRFFHSIDRWELAVALNERAQREGIFCKGCLEVDLAQEPTKTGVSPEDLEKFIRQATALKHLQLRGLMVMPPQTTNSEDSRPYFNQLGQLMRQLNQKALYHSELHELSMGMSQDFAVAIEEGATLVRIGRALFEAPSEKKS